MEIDTVEPPLPWLSLLILIPPSILDDDDDGDDDDVLTNAFLQLRLKGPKKVPAAADSGGGVSDVEYRKISTLHGERPLHAALAPCFLRLMC